MAKEKPFDLAGGSSYWGKNTVNVYGVNNLRVYAVTGESEIVYTCQLHCLF